jgi:hypothetical protein
VLHTQWVDKRAKVFVAEAGARLGRVLRAAGFSGPEVVGAADSYPLSLAVRYRRDSAVVEARLVLSYGGDQFVETRLLLGGDEAAVDVGQDVARNVSEMRRGLDRQALAVRTSLGEPQPSA